MRVDTFMFFDELDMLECRLTELYDAVDYFVLVEADVTHAGDPKPFHYLDNAERFERWADKIVAVQAAELPTSDNPWDREHAQREWVNVGLDRIGAGPDDIILHGDVDEIPTELVASMALAGRSTRGLWVCHQDFYCFAVDWLNPQKWQGTMIGRRRDISSFSAMRDARFTTPNVLPGAGWHFTWVSADIAAKGRKLDAFAHQEKSGWADRLESCWRDGVHLESEAGIPLSPVEVDSSWPRYIFHRDCPEGWFRP